MLQQNILPPVLSATLACLEAGFGLHLWDDSWAEPWVVPGCVLPGYCHLKTYQEDAAVGGVAVISKGFDYVVGMKSESSRSQVARTAGSFGAVGSYIEDIVGDVELGLDGRYSAAPCSTLGHTAGFDNTRRCSALEVHAFAERETFVAVAAGSFPAWSCPKRFANMHSGGMLAVVPPADRNPADCSHSHRTQKGRRLGKPYCSESNRFHRGLSMSLVRYQDLMRPRV